MRALEFFEVANLLEDGQQPPEGCQRSAVSRYYYSAFLEARDQLSLKRNFSFKKRDAHQLVLRALGWSDDTSLRTAGRLLEDLKKLREKADYDTAVVHAQDDVSEAASMASDIRRTVDENDLAHAVDPASR